jgi:hypothetical protein
MAEDRGTAESRAMEQLVFRLAEAFAPRVSEHQIGERVREVFHSFDGSRIRDFVPLLVEGAVRRRLQAELSAADAAASDAAAAEAQQARMAA